MASHMDDEPAEHLLDNDETNASGLERLRTEDEADEQLSETQHSNIRKLLYTSHALSMWNSRVFEFGSFLFLAGLFPLTLLPASIYAFARAASAAALSPFLGSYIDRVDRLRVVRISIVSQRLAVAMSCTGLFLLAEFEHLRSSTWSSIGLAILTLLACIEKLGSVLNTISVERDWVIIVVNGHEERLRVLNSRMRRIDLFCKLFGPLAIALLDGYSTRLAIAATGALTLTSVLVEYYSISRVYNSVRALREAKAVLTRHPSRVDLYATIKSYFARSRVYVRHSAFLPSISLALLHLTVLSFSGQMITYLVALGLSSGMIGILRGASAVFELAATWFAPIIMSRIGPIRAGIWFLNWEIACLAAACAMLWLDQAPTITAAGLVSAVVASRLGLWGYDLSAQIIVQEEVEEHNRGTFSSQEFAAQNLFELLAFATTIIFPRPAQFKFPATISAAAVALAGVLYALFVRSRRGHLIHLCHCIDRHEMWKKRHHWWQTIPEAESLVEDAGTPSASNGRNESPAA